MDYEGYTFVFYHFYYPNPNPNTLLPPLYMKKMKIFNPFIKSKIQKLRKVVRWIVL